MKVEKIKSKSLSENKERNFLFYGLLIYTILFYSQIAARFPSLAQFRLEFFVGSVLVFLSLVKIIKGEISFKENRLNTAALIFLLVSFMTIPFAFVKSLALETFISLFKFFSIYLMIITCIDDEKKLKGGDEGEK